MCLAHVVGIGTGVDAGCAASAASATALATFRKPAPCRSALTPGLAIAVNSRIALIRFGVSIGFACSISAIAPLTTGVAMLVPVKLSYGRYGNALATVPGISHDGVVISPAWNSVLPGAAVETTPTPGAHRSGFAEKSTAVGPAELNGATASFATL